MSQRTVRITAYLAIGALVLGVIASAISGLF